VREIAVVVTFLFLARWPLRAAGAPAATSIGSPLVQRSSTDTNAGQVYVYSGVTQPFPSAGVVTSWSFFDNREAGRLVTPLIFANNGDGTFTVSGMGTSVRSTGQGVQTYPFGLIAGSDQVLPQRYTFGFTDRSYSLQNGQLTAGSFNSGVIEFTGPHVYTDPWEGTSYATTGGPLTLNVGYRVGGAGLPFDFPNGGRIYSAQATELAALPGDANLDGTVNFDDLLIVAQHYGKSGGQAFTDGDFNADGGVGFDDLLVLAQNYGQTGGAGAIAVPVPEPSGLAVLGVLGLLAVHPLFRRLAVERPDGAPRS